MSTLGGESTLVEAAITEAEAALAVAASGGEDTLVGIAATEAEGT